jgi:hypothetical protein
MDFWSKKRSSNDKHKRYFAAEVSGFFFSRRVALTGLKFEKLLGV